MQNGVIDLVQSFYRGVIHSDDEDVMLAESALKIRGMKKAIEERHALLVGPYKEITKALDAKKKSMVDPIDEVLDHIRKERGRWATLKADAAMAEKRRLDKERQDALDKKNREEAAARALGVDDHAPVMDFVERDQALEREQTQVMKAGKTKGYRMVWKHEVMTAAEVPRQYLAVDESAIKRAVALGVRDIPGVRIYEEPYVAIR